MKGTIFNIQKFCINDGPGIRTTVFFKGCPLKCAWCHNPESQQKKSELLYDSQRCVGCGKCAAACQVGAHAIKNGIHTYNRDCCTACGSCAEVCCSEALEIAGKEESVDGILHEVMKDKAFYDNSGGGLTLSGGEPMMQFDFVFELLKGAKACALHTCIETCGFADTEKMLTIAPFTDIFLYDYKLTDDNLHKEYTGVSNSLIKKNLYAIDTTDSKIVLRCPIIPGVNDNEAHFDGIARMANSLNNIIAIELEPYHSLGNNKYNKLNKVSHSFSTPESTDVEGWIKSIQRRTEVTVKKA